VPHPASIEPLRRWDPEQIGGYVLIGRLGAGAMGQVFLGRSAAGRLVAVKTIKIEYAEEPDFRTRFAHEVAAARRVSGAFTAPVVAADPEADVPWLATSYVPAPSLSTLVRTCGPLSVPAVRWLAAGCAEALESIHNAGLVHRDLKPSNVLVSPDGPRVIDFGVARAAERVQLTLTRGTVGTPAYMAPEQARDTRQATSASDVYSLGATMVLAATGHSPYHGDSVIDVLVQLATAPPDLSGLPGDLAGFIAACLERDPRRRPTSAGLLAYLAADLQAASDSSELGLELLSAEALALIAEYRADPRSHSGSGAGSAPDSADDDETVGSQPAYAVLFPASPRGQGPPGQSGTGRDSAPGEGSGRGRGSDPGGWFGARWGAEPEPGAGSGAGAEAGASAARPGARPSRRAGPRRAVLTGLAALVAALALVAGGTALSAHLAGAARGPGDVGRSDGTPGVSASPSARSPHATTSGNGRDSAQPTGSGVRTSGRLSCPPVVPRRPPRGPLGPPLGPPKLKLSQRYGDGDTGFIVCGRGWLPGSEVTVTLVGVGTSPSHPTADSAGTFYYVINEFHEFFPGMLPPGRYQVLVTGAGLRRSAFFTVNSLRPGPSGPGNPPPG